MEYLLIIIAAIIALIGWLESKKRPLWLTITFIILLGVFFAVQLVIQKEQNEDADKSRYYGVLKSEEIILSSTDNIYPAIEFGWQYNESGATVQYRGGPLTNLFEGSEATIFEDIFKNISLKVSKDSNQIKVSISLLDSNGSLLAELIDNEWKVNPPPRTFDRNYTKDTLEVKNADGYIVLQIRLLKDRIQLNGVFWSRNGLVFAIFPPDESKPDWVPLYISKNKWPSKKLKPIFKYPSEFHLGEFDID